MKHALTRFFLKFARSSPSLQKYYEFAETIALRGMNIGGGSACEHSGESYVIKHVIRQFHDQTITIFDVGANHGQYAALCATLLKDHPYKLYCFEPSSTAFSVLAKNISGSNIHLIQIGLGEKNEQRVLYANEAGSALSSLYNRRLDHFKKIKTFAPTETTAIDTIDNFSQSQGISRINLLKLDVEGNELACLEGAKTMIKSGNIDYIQFEFGGCNIDSRTFFQDFFYLLSPQYRLYRVLIDGLSEITHYDERLERFLTTNYLAERKDLLP